ncbi:MAG TPA: hypothetical protein PLD10_24410 [Rhodopila sp.]|nr:hypothetical protein [Rhodopila sp.]
MTNSVPATHLTEALKLEAEGYVDLFKIVFYQSSTLYIKSDNTVSWNGQVWEGIALKLTGVASYGDTQVSRPKLQLQNPDAIWSPFVSEGVLEGAMVTRYRVLNSDLAANNPVYISQTWQVGRVMSCTRLYIIMELRSLIDAPNFLIPARLFAPPAFPTVSTP